MKNLWIILICSGILTCSQQDWGPVFDPWPAFSAIEQARKTKSVNISEIEGQYTRHLLDTVRNRAPSAHLRISGAIVQAKAGNKRHVQSQIISKTLQLFFFHEMVIGLQSLKGLERSSYIREIRKIRAYYACLQPTVVRRSQWINRERELDDICMNELGRIEDRPSAAVLREAVLALEHTLVQVYILSVLYELEGIEKNRGQHADICEEKEAEGRIFFETVSGYIDDKSKTDHLRSLLAVPYREMDTELIRTLMREAFKQLPAI